jgi:hypothetical protein
MDAYEQRAYADYDELMDLTKTKVMNCKVMPPSAPEGYCKSVDEYNAFVAQYME